MRCEKIPFVQLPLPLSLPTPCPHTVTMPTALCGVIPALSVELGSPARRTRALISMQMFYFTWKNNDFFHGGVSPCDFHEFPGQCGSHTSLNFTSWPSPQHPRAVLCLCPPCKRDTGSLVRQNQGRRIRVLPTLSILL